MSLATFAGSLMGEVSQSISEISWVFEGRKSEAISKYQIESFDLERIKSETCQRQG
jgi:hypothetical protein